MDGLDGRWMDVGRVDGWTLVVSKPTDVYIFVAVRFRLKCKIFRPERGSYEITLDGKFFECWLAVMVMQNFATCQTLFYRDIN